MTINFVSILFHVLLFFRTADSGYPQWMPLLTDQHNELLERELTGMQLQASIYSLQWAYLRGSGSALHSNGSTINYCV